MIRVSKMYTQKKFDLLELGQRDLEAATNITPKQWLFSINSNKKNVNKFYIAIFLDCELSCASPINKLQVFFQPNLPKT